WTASLACSKELWREARPSLGGGLRMAAWFDPSRAPAGQETQNEPRHVCSILGQLRCQEKAAHGPAARCVPNCPAWFDLLPHLRYPYTHRPSAYPTRVASPSRQSAMAEQYIFTIESLTKLYGKREVLKNIWLAFYPGAKIGVIGSNGAGKSSLLRIMAGVDQ